MFYAMLGRANYTGIQNFQAPAPARHRPAAGACIAWSAPGDPLAAAQARETGTSWSWRVRPPGSPRYRAAQPRRGSQEGTRRCCLPALGAALPQPDDAVAVRSMDGA